MSDYRAAGGGAGRMMVRLVGFVCGLTQKSRISEAVAASEAGPTPEQRGCRSVGEGLYFQSSAAVTEEVKEAAVWRRRRRRRGGGGGGGDGGGGEGDGGGGGCDGGGDGGDGCGGDGGG